ncbi:hypothetical protein AADR41_42475, partial [Streptomyces sp. CLV115]|uniref:hypothetical protein n=1 Tax=Streptomyces sp. CLV115 TaxID=3138502 RepID=UPI00313E5FA9
MTQTGVAATQARIDMVELAGGADAFTKTVTDYYAKFYTPKEQHDYTGRALSTEFDAMGLTLPKTVEGFRALVDSVGTATPEAQALTLQLMKLGPTFYDFATSIVGLDGQMHTLDETKKQHISLQQALDVATGAKSQRQVENENRRAS